MIEDYWERIAADAARRTRRRTYRHPAHIRSRGRIVKSLSKAGHKDRTLPGKARIRARKAAQRAEAAA